jgi:hypothetical protein
LASQDQWPGSFKAPGGGLRKIRRRPGFRDRKAGSVQGQGDSGNDGSKRIPDAYWAALAQELLHPLQISIIEALWESDEPLTAKDLAGTLKGVHSSTIYHHLGGRLRRINAVAYAERPSARNATDTPFRIVRSPDDES